VPRIWPDPATTPPGQSQKQRPHLLLNAVIAVGSGFKPAS
jgi:hypothetical protein